MGILKRTAERSQNRFWSAVPTEPGEQRLDYAHLALIFDSGERPGTAYLTDRRLVWVTPQGAVVLDLRLEDCTGWAVPDARPDGLVVVVPPNPGAEPGPLLMCPQNPRSSANRQLAQGFFEAVKAQLGLIHPEWQTQN